MSTATQTPTPSHGLNPPSFPLSRSRTSSLQNRVRPLNIASQVTESPDKDGATLSTGDIFEKSGLISSEGGTLKNLEDLDSPNAVPEGFDDLPVELVSLLDRFIDSLSAKVYNTPPSIEKLSDIFQDFYSKASSHIATHISALSTLQLRGSSSNISLSSRSSQPRPPDRSSSRDTLNSTPEQPLLTPQEVSDRRKARRLLEKKRLALEEAVERRVCERVYGRIWRHRSTLDDARDEKLRSRTAALAVVGIGLKDLGIDIDDGPSKSDEMRTVEAWVSCARNGLLCMNDSKYPLGKLEQLAEAHKNIVDMLTDIHNSSSSADEILPTLIYCLITTPPEGINVISNMHFIQRFRNSSKIDGEAAYCLTNLEAAITFLETVDLATLRSDEKPEGPTPDQLTKRSVTPHMLDSKPEVPRESTPAAMSSPALIEAGAIDNSRVGTPDPSKKEEPVPTQLPQDLTHRRRVSNIFQPPAVALGAAGDAVRNTADQSIKGIGSALDNSFKLLFGRLGEQKAASPNPDTAESIFVPKTLDEARKLVEAKTADDDSIFADIEDTESRLTAKASDNLLNAIAGKRQSLRETSVDSSHSIRATQSDSAPSANGAIESMRNFGNSINPLKGFGSMNVMRGFGRTSSSGIPTLANMNVSNVETPMLASQRSGSPVQGVISGIKTLPPIQRFVDVSDARDLKINDIPELLEDYKRLAEALKTLGAF